jgi:hypothetical protein
MLLQKDRFLSGPNAAEENFAPEAEEPGGAAFGPGETATSAAAGGRKPQPLSLFGERLQSALHKPKEGG